MKDFFRSIPLLLAAMLLAVSCSKDKESGSLAFDTPAKYLRPGQSVTVGFSASDIKSVSVTSNPQGWGDAMVDLDARTVTITAPLEFNDETEKSGSVVISGVSSGGSSVSASLFVGVLETVDMSSRPANSYLVSEAETNYLFDALHKGDGTSSLATSSLKIIWQSASKLIQYLDFQDGKGSFYVGAGDDGKVKQGNALIGAYDADGELLWSWHIWATDYDPSAADGSVELNGYTMMTRNLGARGNANGSASEILDSYGLYYQWGRKDPFIGPSTYQANNGTSAAMYTEIGGRVYLVAEAADSERGTAEYALQHPFNFIFGTEESAYDWMSGSHTERLWDSRKTVNDPCPYGWQVAPAAAFAGLSIVETLAGVEYSEYEDKFGWTLSDGNAQSLFMGAGRRIYTETQQGNGGTIQNVYSQPTRSSALYGQPWVGYYWTSDVASASKAAAFYFWFDKSNVAGSGIEHLSPQYRANGMQVRCVRTR